MFFYSLAYTRLPKYVDDFQEWEGHNHPEKPLIDRGSKLIVFPSYPYVSRRRNLDSNYFKETSSLSPILGLPRPTLLKPVPFWPFYRSEMRPNRPSSLYQIHDDAVPERTLVSGKIAFIPQLLSQPDIEFRDSRHSSERYSQPHRINHKEERSIYVDFPANFPPLGQRLKLSAHPKPSRFVSHQPPTGSREWSSRSSDKRLKTENSQNSDIVRMEQVYGQPVIFPIFDFKPSNEHEKTVLDSKRFYSHRLYGNHTFTPPHSKAPSPDQHPSFLRTLSPRSLKNLVSGLDSSLRRGARANFNFASRQFESPHIKNDGRWTQKGLKSVVIPQYVQRKTKAPRRSYGGHFLDTSVFKFEYEQNGKALSFWYPHKKYQGAFKNNFGHGHGSFEREPLIFGNGAIPLN